MQDVCRMTMVCTTGDFEKGNVYDQVILLNFLYNGDSISLLTYFTEVL